jgi:uncharacterized Zn-binding protein involved in type VI secretion
MPGLLLHVGASMQCTHQAPSTIVASQARVLVNGQPAATSADLITVAGCPFTVPGPKPQPCVTVRWVMTSSRVLIGGMPALLQPGPGSGSGICQSPEQIPQGPPAVASLQLKVTAQ